MLCLTIGEQIRAGAMRRAPAGGPKTHDIASQCLNVQCTHSAHKSVGITRYRPHVFVSARYCCFTGLSVLMPWINLFTSAIESRTSVFSTLKDVGCNRYLPAVILTLLHVFYFLDFKNVSDRCAVSSAWHGNCLGENARFAEKLRNLSKMNWSSAKKY
jgi:hypothetical protein